MKPAKQSKPGRALDKSTQNPSVKKGQYGSEPHGNGNGTKINSSRRYFFPADDGNEWPPELGDYNKRFTNTLEKIKRRHDGVVTTVGKSSSAQSTRWAHD